MADLTDLQKEILQTKRDHPEFSAQRIADEVGCSYTHANQTLNEYDTSVLDSKSTTSPSSSSSSNSGGNSILYLLFVWPVKATIGITMLGIQLTLSIFAMGVKLLRAIFGRS